jgi:hypothetical protein
MLEEIFSLEVLLLRARCLPKPVVPRVLYGVVGFVQCPPKHENIDMSA